MGLLTSFGVSKMSCKLDKKPCDPASLVCRLNPNDPNPYFNDSTSGARIPFINRYCCNFKKNEGK